jgi:flagellum-specific peptidoglycan hydrolase FlgJ
MPLPIYFDPDPQIPDSDILGIGDLVLDDGSRRFLNGEPDIAGSLPRVPGMQLDTPPLIDPMAMQRQPEPLIGADGQAYQIDQTGTFTPVNSLALEGAPPMADYQPGGEGQGGMGIMEVGNPEMQRPSPVQQEPALMGALQDQAPDMLPTSLLPQSPEDLQRQPEPLQAADGRMYQVDQTGQFVPYERTGALPPDVAQRQLSELDQMQQQTLGATELARADEARIVNEAVLQQLAANEAQKTIQEEEIREQQFKIERWQKEQQALADMEPDTGLIGAHGGGVGGVLGSLFAIAGATLLGGAGSDAGLRMIDNSIERNVREQVRRRDTKLGLLANQIQSSEQAIKMGKAELYKNLADRTELLAQKTKNDVYEAQSPSIIQTLRQKQLENMQEAERLSLGKVTERVPAPPKPPSEAMLQKYGELRRDRDGANNIASRAEQQLGLLWVPGKNGQAGQYRNKAEVLDKGIQGVGALEQWVPDFVYSTMGGMTAEGYQVRGAAEAMAYAQIRQMQPTGPISNADIQAAVKAGALNTEEGLIRGLERIRLQAEGAAAHDAAQYGPEVVGEYERRYRRSGGQTLGDVAPGRPAALQDKQQEIDRLMNKGKQQRTSASTMPEDPQQRMAMLAEDLQALGGEELPPEGLAILRAQAGHETADGKRLPTNNFFGHKASQRSRAAGRGVANLETTEGEGANAKRLKQNFATFNSSAESVADHLSLLKRKYPRAWEALQAGDEGAYVAALKDGGYFTGPEGAYLAGIQRRL